MAQNNYFRFKTLEICNYGAFVGRQKFTFDSPVTIFHAQNGTGKNTLVNVLKHLGLESGVKPRKTTSNGRYFVEVLAEGDTQLLENYHDLIFIEGYTEGSFSGWIDRLPNAGLDWSQTVIRQTETFIKKLS